MAMKSTNSIPLPPAKPGEEVEVSVDLVAPSTSGIQRSTWMPRSITNEYFDYPIHAEIEVQFDADNGSVEARYEMM